jgi:hypothetical protein
LAIVVAPLTVNVLLKLVAPPTLAVDDTFMKPTISVLPTRTVLAIVSTPLTVRPPRAKTVP